MHQPALHSCRRPNSLCWRVIRILFWLVTCVGMSVLNWWLYCQWTTGFERLHLHPLESLTSEDLHNFQLSVKALFLAIPATAGLAVHGLLMAVARHDRSLRPWRANVRDVQVSTGFLAIGAMFGFAWLLGDHGLVPSELRPALDPVFEVASKALTSFGLFAPVILVALGLNGSILPKSVSASRSPRRKQGRKP